MLIRPAETADAAAIAAIYSHYVRETCITFICKEPSAQHYAAQIAEGKYPFLVAEEEGEVIGFAYASAFRPHDAFRWDVELTIYLRPGREGKGTGSRLMSALLDELTRLGYLTAYSCITVPNEPSVALHRRFGFDELGVFPATGYKHGQWHGVLWMSKTLADLPNPPEEPRTFRAPQQGREQPS
ncbi:MAG: N-acetyltransferase [Christensenellaceae bacterium]|nr:N-acetyltransferase [Christensenellaceae bacterium]